ncbi:MAG: type II toxin-antitoxin system VapB family antitoxin [Acidimicrobiales bacterium]
MSRRTSVNIDDELLAAARAVLRTKGLKDTIDAAFHEVVRADQRRRLVERFRTGAGIDDDALSSARESWVGR